VNIKESMRDFRESSPKNEHSLIVPNSYISATDHWLNVRHMEKLTGNTSGFSKLSSNWLNSTGFQDF